MNYMKESLKNWLWNSFVFCQGIHPPFYIDSSPDIDVRTKVLKIALKMITSRNVEHFIGILKKELINTVEQDFEKVFNS